MVMTRLEHVNISVTDPERTARILARITGWKERWRGPAINGGWTIHLGSETDYIALYMPPGPAGAPFAKGAPLQHIGLVVDDLAEAERIAIAEGLTPFNHQDYEPGRRFYLFDPDGIEFEFVSYA